MGRLPASWRKDFFIKFVAGADFNCGMVGPGTKGHNLLPRKFATCCCNVVLVTWTHLCYIIDARHTARWYAIISCVVESPWEPILFSFNDNILMQLVRVCVSCAPIILQLRGKFVHLQLLRSECIEFVGRSVRARWSCPFHLHTNIYLLNAVSWWRHIPEDGILHSPLRQDLKSYLDP
jgi:hypothetical protein